MPGAGAILRAPNGGFILYLLRSLMWDANGDYVGQAADGYCPTAEGEARYVQAAGYVISPAARALPENQKVDGGFTT